MARTKQETREARSEAIEKLREWYPKGSTVYTILRHVSRSGMQREIGLVMIGDRDEQGYLDLRHPNFAAADVLGLRMNKSGDGVTVGGCGMDMGYHLAYELSYALHGDGYALNHRWL